MAFTYFFRDMQTLDTIKDFALPYLKTCQHIKIWDAGCAMGPEPYSLAIILRENMTYRNFKNVEIISSDIDGSDLIEKVIAEGSYPRTEVQRIPELILNKYFIPNSDKTSYTILSEIRNSVKFMKHDLLTLVPVEKDVGLIVCKNVLLHFTQEERIKVFKMFYDALSEGGFLATEQTQKLPEEVKYLFEPVVSNAQVFRKLSTGGRLI